MLPESRDSHIQNILAHLPEASGKWKSQLRELSANTSKTIRNKALLAAHEIFSTDLDLSDETKLLGQVRSHLYLPLIHADRPTGTAKEPLSHLAQLLSFDLRHHIAPHIAPGAPHVQMAFTTKRGTAASDWLLLQDGKPYFMGKKQWSDLVLPGDCDVSRLHCVVMLIGDQVVIVDLGSLSGLVMKSRTRDLALESSLPASRRVLVIPSDDFVVFDLGHDVELQINGPSCIACNSAPRTILIEPCHHFVLCRRCCEAWTQQHPTCPTCRAPVAAFNKHIGVASLQCAP